MKTKIPKSHPRYESLMTREKIAKGVERGITSPHGLIAQGRGEAWDYLLGEKTNSFADAAISASAAMLILAKHPVISVNGNTAALVPTEIVRLGKSIPAKIEVNIFHASKKREKAIRKELIWNGAKEVLMPSRKFQIKHIEHNRKYVNQEGIFKADVVFVPLEDGDRCEALERNSKKVITIDLNPLSRTSRTASITIVDNITRAIRKLSGRIEKMKKMDRKRLEAVLINYDNQKILKKARESIKKNL